MSDDLSKPAAHGRDCGTELLEWHDVRHIMPDAEISVLAWIRDDTGGCDWWAAWWDGERWADCATGDIVHGTVTHWAQPVGPANAELTGPPVGPRS